MINRIFPKKSLNMRILWIVFLLTAIRAACQDVVADTAVRLLSRQFSFTEGASVDREGDVFFTDQPNNRIWEYDLKGRLTIFLDCSGRSNGMYFDRKGWLVTCADEHDQLWAISPRKNVKVLLKDIGGRRMNGPNDLWIDGNGGIYFTDPYYQRPYWTRTKSDLPGEWVYYLPAGAPQPEIVDSDVVKPNGIVGTPDGKYLYVADIGAGKTYKYSIGPDGSVTDRRLFAAQGSDGMTLDDRGDVYLTGDGVTVYDPSGATIAAYRACRQKWDGQPLFWRAGQKDPIYYCFGRVCIVSACVCAASSRILFDHFPVSHAWYPVWLRRPAPAEPTNTPEKNPRPGEVE